jgi:NADPH-dependent glutamate synthase beta subunit-like oxidoreductase/NAD(P)H-flavin reductase
MSELNLKFDVKFEDLYETSGLSKLDGKFINYLKQANVDLYNQLVAVRRDNSSMEKKDVSNLLIEIAPYLEDFISELFLIETEVKNLQKSHGDIVGLYSCKRLFVQRRASKICKPRDAGTLDGTKLEKQITEKLGGAFDEKIFATQVNIWLEDEESNAENIEIAGKYAIWALETDAGKAKHGKGILFKKPNKLDFENLVPVETEIVHGVTMIKLPEHDLRQRDGFALTDDGVSLEKTLDVANYCIFCHNQGKDSCSTGLVDKKTAEFKTSPTKVTLNGCPLEEKISEMNMLKGQGFSVGALAVVTIDNPMCAGTGYRICNDCVKSCVYQKQDPVDIPLVETHNLKDVLNLPWGFEIYSLLTRWNPLNIARPIPREDTGYKVLTVGLGPAGFTLSHHLMNDGHTIVAVDGLKIEPLPAEISGVTQAGGRVSFKPIKDIKADLYEKLDERTLAGFGGVAEYGITVRWDKNYLKVLRLLLERRSSFRMFGGVRFGSSITYDQAFNMGFDHIALAMGAGKPTVITMPNALARGVRTASDFLMSLQLSGAAKKNSIANLQVRLPIVVIGGGLTGIDTTTESLAYYPIQVEKFLVRYEKLVSESSEKAVRERWGAEETEIAEEFITHAKAIRDEKTQAVAEGRKADIISLLKSWGGSTLAYRRRMIDSPAYRLNHEEVEKALEEGIYFLENASPIAVEVDKYRHACGLRVKLGEEEKVLPAKTILMAAGTSPNTVLQREEPEKFGLDGKYFQAIDIDGNNVSPEWSAKPSEPQMFISKNNDNRLVSFFGDLHPSFAGNVVKAMGSAKQTYPLITEALQASAVASNASTSDFFKKMDSEFVATVHEVIRLTSNIIEVIVHAPQAARNFKPGQFYRLQNFEANALRTNEHLNTTLAMEGLALTGASVDVEKGLLSTIVLEMGGSSSLCINLKKGEPIILMGPTGEPTHTPAGETVMLVGGGLGNAVLFSIGKAMRDAGTKVLYFAGYKKSADRYKVKDIETAADIIIWCCDEATFTPERPQDRSFHGNIVEAMVAYASGMLGNQEISMNDVDRLITIGSDRMMEAVSIARHTKLKEHLKPEHIAVGSINSPMQCMMKEICAQCLQKHVDKETGEETYVYSCFNQDQCLDKVDFPHLNERLKQNGVQEKLTAKWIEHCLDNLVE